jgi:very-short-patch-repair endonuclease
MKDFLYTRLGKLYLEEEYVQKERSTYDIAKERGTYANKIRRGLVFHGLPLRDKCNAQKAALKSGRHFHPTRGRQRTPEERQRISESMAQAWREMPEDERQRRVEIARRQWEGMSEEERQRLLQLAGEGMRRAAAEGSNLEKHLFSGLVRAGYSPNFHADFSTDYPIDILLSHEKIAVEVDGPSHHLPIWGEEQLSKTIQADHAKTGTLIAAGYVVMRIKSLTKTVSEHQKRVVLARLLEVVRSVEAEFPPLERRLVELEVN